jgi:uncharacterized protein YkwD
LAAWMGSPVHRGIILGRYDHVGIGYAAGGNYWVATLGSGGRC